MVFLGSVGWLVFWGGFDFLWDFYWVLLLGVLCECFRWVLGGGFEGVKKTLKSWLTVRDDALRCSSRKRGGW